MPTPLTELALGLEAERLTRERDFFRQLLELGGREEIEPFLEEALSMVVALSGARRGYIEVQDEPGRSDQASTFSLAHGYYDAEVDGVRAAFSRGVIAEAIATGRTILTDSALSDPRFQKRDSVVRNRTEAVLCAPIGVSPPMGVIYLQDREKAGSFSTEDCGLVETFARHLAAFADRLLLKRRRRDAADPTWRARASLRAEGVIGRSPALAHVLEQLALVAPKEVTVLLTGASGTGKTQLARVIHENSPRRAGRFVDLNCATFVESLVESELFGAVRGAHSTATRGMPGKISAANRGTLFLDEVGELPLAVQAKLLQFLQDRVYYPLGSDKPERADVRIIAATNVDLRAAVAQRRFREDLLYRLDVMPVHVPPLSARREDILDIAEHFCQRACARHGLPPLRLSVGAARAVELAEWPGNVRELENKVEAAVIRAGEGATQVELRHFFPETRPASSGDGGSAGREIHGSFQEETRRFQKQLVQRALNDTDWNVSEAAERLDLSRAHLYNLIAAFGLKRG
ncbi:sigma-54-dependent Fis family transcriptional regulator [Myxococcus stipitatus]|uniref:sigma-54-dependent Fis family transcriptional regulator n=1 Tax=Myxococcus stipitatus TaxID=83455 RepID=UPI0030D4A996